jgi:hypothetical protein
MNTFDQNDNGSGLPGNLNTADLDRLQKFGIPPVLIRAAGIQRVTSVEARFRCGIDTKGDMGGVAYPTFGPSGQIVGWRLRRDHPEMERGKPKNKWITSRDPQHLYFTPGTRKWMSDASVTAVFVEAYTSALAIDALCERAQRQFCAIATGGCWNWRGQTGIAVSEDGTRVPEKGPLSDLNHIEFLGRKVIICFDSNAKTSRNVKAAQRAFIRELVERGANVLIANIPNSANVNGPDDLIAEKGDEALLDVLNQAPPPGTPQNEGNSQADRIVDLILSDDIELFHRTVDEPYSTVAINGHRETWSITSKGFRRWVARRFWEAFKKAPSAKAIQDALNVLVGKALHDSPQHNVHVRIADKDGVLYLDLCDDQWRTIEIAPTGWHVVSEAPVKFMRTRGMLPLSLPRPGGNLDDLRSFINFGTEEYWALIKAWLIAAFRPNYPFAILIVMGEQGSAKSTLQRVLRSLVDPNKAPLRSFPREPRDLMIAATNGWICAFDNISTMPQWLSDDLCRLATGGGFATRELYSDADEKIFDAMRPIMLNGIADVATRPDLLDRSIVLNLPVITDSQRRDEEELQRSFLAAQPALLGALLDQVSGALKNLGSVHLKAKPRMADFSRFAIAAEIGSGTPSGTFLNAYLMNRSGSNVVALEASIIGTPLVHFIETRKSWSGTHSQLLHELTDFAGERITKNKQWPTSFQKFSPELRRIAPNLRHASIQIKFGEHTKIGNTVTLQKMTETASPSSPASPGQQLNPLDGEPVGDPVQEIASPPPSANPLNPLAGDPDDPSDAVSQLSEEYERYEI